ncbi:MAG: TonB-dependent receptor [Gracilimonas sp.]
MAVLFLLSLLIITPFYQSDQLTNNITFLVLDEESGEPLRDATVYISELDRGTVVDEDGRATFEDLPEGIWEFLFRYVGYEAFAQTIYIPYEEDQPIEIRMSHDHEEHEEITVSTTRSNRTIENAPTRVEAITIEEIEEKANMRPGDIRMLLAESTGIQVQQTSAVTGNSNFRIQGLDGRYTQLLKDGFPLYSGFSGGLSIMQIPPLDLKQVEVIKGANSTLYGGGAIAGLVNLVSKEPAQDRELSVLANVSSSNGRDFSGFYSDRFGDFGLTLFSAYNQNSGYDPSDQGFSAVPKYDRFLLNPKLFWYPGNGTKVMAAAHVSVEDRLGGDMRYINNEDRSGTYFEQHETQRISTRFSVDHRFSERTSLTVKNSLTFFDRSITIPDYYFDGYQTASFSEAAINYNGASNSWVGGLNFWTDNFEDQSGGPSAQRDFNSMIVGGFIQHTTELTEQFSLESGFRADLVDPAPEDQRSGWFLLPRVSALYKLNNEWSMRFGGGMGYKLPEMFTDDAENRTFQNVLAPDFEQVKAEESYGLNYDVNFRTVLNNEFVIRVNQLFYYTYLDNPLVLEEGNDNFFRVNNLKGHIRSRGAETNLAFIREPLKLFFGYTYVDAVEKEESTTHQVPLNSPHQINTILMFEEHGSYRLGFESYYYSAQQLNDGSTGQSYTIFGIMGEKTWGRYTVFANLENMFDTRQTRFSPIYTGSRQQPEFEDIFAPLEGRYVNVGVKVRL